MVSVAIIAIALMSVAGTGPASPTTTSVIIQGNDMAPIAKAVEKVGGEVTHQLGIINAVVADLSPSQIDALRELPAVSRLYPNRTVESAAKKVKTDKSLVIVDPTTTAVDSTLAVAEAADDAALVTDDAGTALFPEDLWNDGLTETMSINVWVDQQ